MEKDTRLLNIYLNIHHKKTLTMDDLRYLAQYAPECFEKTCKNVVYNIPETKPIMEPASTNRTGAESGFEEDGGRSQTSALQEQNAAQLSADTGPAAMLSVEQNIEQILENLKLLETNEFPVADVSANDVKDLLGNLYMELLFPHNDRDTFFNPSYGGNTSSFDQKI